MLEQLVGQSLDRYQLVELLGEGGMGGVFRARDATLQRDVAIKVMHSQFARQPNFQERFLQEARAAARLDHPGIVRVFDFGQSRDLLYIVMEFIRGDNLRQRLEDVKARGQRVALAEAVQLVRQVGLALDYAHRQGILHRDVKPDNIMLKPEPAAGLPYRPVLTDLGLARLLEGGMLTVEGTSMGTPSYMSPEQALGERTDARSDVYSLGILLYELATGCLPFAISTLTEAIRYHTKEPPPSPRSIRPDLPEPVERAILKALAKRADDRFADAGAMAQALHDALPAAEATRATEAGAIGLRTQYEEGPGQLRGPSILDEFPQVPAGLNRDRISILAPDGTVRAVPIEAPEFTIGRSPENDLALDDARVSRHHARLHFDGTSYKVTDLNSSNGTFLGNARLLPGVPDVWTPGKPLRIGDAWLRLERAGPGAAPGMTAGPRIGSAEAGPSRVAAFIEAPELSVDPGSSVTAVVTIVNQATLVDHFQVSVSGLPADWVPTLPPLIRLLPGARQAVSLVLRPPRSPESQAGTYTLVISAASQDAPGQVAEVQARLSVRPYFQSQSELKPQAIMPGKPAEVRVTNQGNAPQAFTVTWQDRGEELAFKPPQAEVTVPAGKVGTVAFRAEPRRRRWVGGRKTHPFSATVAAAGGAAQALNGDMVSSGLIPAWLPPLVAAPLIALCILVAMLVSKPPVIDSITMEPPNPVAGEPVTVHWVVRNAQSIELRPFVSDLDPEAGEYTFPQGLAAATTLTFVARNRFGATEQPVNVGVIARAPTATPEPGAPVVDEFTVFPTTVIKGQPVTIRWRVSNAESVTLQPLGNVENADELQDTPQQTIRYTLLATNKGKTVQKSQEVVVELPLPGAPVISAFAVEPNQVVKGDGGTVRLSWDTQQADTVAIEPGIGPVGPVGSHELPAPASDTVYTLVARNAGGETRAEARVLVVDPTPTPTATPTPPISPSPTPPTISPSPTPAFTPTPGPVWQHAVTLTDRRAVYHLRLTGAGQVRVRAIWSGTQTGLALIINGPGRTGAYARRDGASPLEVTYDVTAADLATGDHWRVTVASFGNGQANGTVEIAYPSGSSVSPFSTTFVVQPGHARSVSVIVLRGRLLGSGGTIEGRATWTGTPAELALIINGPGRTGYYARRNGPSPLAVTYDAPGTELDRGDTWTVTLAAFSAANAQGEIKLYYPYIVWKLKPPSKGILPSP